MYNEYKGDTREMDWTARLNKVMDYVEENIHGEIAAVSYTHLGEHARKLDIRVFVKEFL